MTALLALTLCASLTFAQSRDPEEQGGAPSVYLRAGAGYGFAHAGGTEINGKIISGSEALDGNSYALNVDRASFGSGLAANIAAGYMITKHLGVELGVHAVVSPRKHTFNGLVPNFANRPYTSVMYSKLPVYLVPALVLTTGGRLQVYSRAGIVLPFSGKLMIKETSAATGQGQTEQVYTSELKNRFTPGFQGAIGLGRALTSHLSVWAEANITSLNVYAKRSELTGYTENGIDGLGAFTTNQKVTEYDFNYETPLQPAATEPNKAPTFSVPFGSVGLCVGVRYAF
jgi:hypothetical protein